MASYQDLRTLWNDSGMKNKVAVAITIAADAINKGTDTNPSDFDQSAGAHDARLAWVKNVEVYNPGNDLIQTFWNAVLAANDSASTATILGASDTLIQTNVNQTVDVLASGEA